MASPFLDFYYELYLWIIWYLILFWFVIDYVFLMWKEETPLDSSSLMEVPEFIELPTEF